VLGIRGIGIYLRRISRISAHVHPNNIAIYSASVSPPATFTNQHPTAAFRDNASQAFHRPGFALRMHCRRVGSGRRSTPTRTDQLSGQRRAQSLSIMQIQRRTAQESLQAGPLQYQAQWEGQGGFCLESLAERYSTD
jgi:hypothetical protein